MASKKLSLKEQLYFQQLTRFMYFFSVREFLRFVTSCYHYPLFDQERLRHLVIALLVEFDLSRGEI